MPYKLEWFLVLEATPYGLYVKAVCGSAIRERAEEIANECGGTIRHVCCYGMGWHAGQKFEG